MTQIARITLTIDGIRPPIWRRIEVPEALSMAALSDVICAAFGWTNTHLHEFVAGKRRIVMADPDGDQPAGLGYEDENGVRLAGLLASGIGKLTYLYDFGDDWRHRLAVEERGAADPAKLYPRVLDGRRAAPPEDCGGTSGYRHLLEVLADPSHEEYAELRAWCPHFDAEEFDLAAADLAVRNPPGSWE